MVTLGITKILAQYENSGSINKISLRVD